MKTKLMMMGALAAACAVNELAAMPTAEETNGGYTWSYRAKGDEATLVAEKDGKHSCAVSPGEREELGGHEGLVRHPAGL